MKHKFKDIYSIHFVSRSSKIIHFSHCVSFVCIAETILLDLTYTMYVKNANTIVDTIVVAHQWWPFLFEVKVDSVTFWFVLH